MAARTETQVRWMICRDMPEVMDIERQSFPHPWDDEHLLERLRQRNCIALVAERSDKVIGFTVYELLKSYLHVLNLAVHPQYRRQGVGRQIIDKLKSKLLQQRRTELRIEVSDENLAAQCFFREMEFKATNIIRGHYDETDSDAYVMRYRLRSPVVVDKWNRGSLLESE